MGSKQKVSEYLKYKGFSPYSFEKKLGLSNGVLKSGKDFGVDKLKLIRDNYPDLNMQWLLFDEGESLMDEEIIRLDDIVS